MTKTQLQINKICLAALFLALGWLMPFLTGQIKEFGSMLLPMHLPVMISGFVLGPIYGAFIGFITPLTRSLIFGMPNLLPTALAMCFELMTYGFICGGLFIFLSKYVRKLPTIVNIYISLISAMIIGRCIWGLAYFLFNFAVADAAPFTLNYFLVFGFANAWPGIILQLVLIPSLIQLLYSQKLIQKMLPDYARVFKKWRNKEVNSEDSINTQE